VTLLRFHCLRRNVRISSKEKSARIIDLANAQHGVVARRQLLGLGISPGGVEARVTSGWLTKVYRGVFAVGHSRLTVQGQWMAATLAGGPGAALSHRTAASHWGLVLPPGRIDVLRDVATGSSVPRYAGRPAPYGRPIVFHRSRVFRGDDFEVRNGILTTALHRTFLDLAATWTLRQMDSAFSEAERNGLVRIERFREAADRGKGWSGISKLRAIVREWDPESTRTRSELENEFRRLCRRHELPLPEVNVVVNGFEVDCFWRDQGLIVELDGFRYHRAPTQRNTDM
jgi:hypothetical protein